MCFFYFRVLRSNSQKCSLPAEDFESPLKTGVFVPQLWQCLALLPEPSGRVHGQETATFSLSLQLEKGQNKAWRRHRAHQQTTWLRRVSPCKHTLVLNVIIREELCNADIKLVVVSLHPFYLSKECSQLFFILVYVHPRANASTALEHEENCELPVN